LAGLCNLPLRSVWQAEEAAARLAAKYAAKAPEIKGGRFVDERVEVVLVKTAGVERTLSFDSLGCALEEEHGDDLGADMIWHRKDTGTYRIIFDGPSGMVVTTLTHGDEQIGWGASGRIAQKELGKPREFLLPMQLHRVHDGRVFAVKIGTTMFVLANEEELQRVESDVRSSTKLASAEETDDVEVLLPTRS
jgi:hypothetical protein